MSTKKTYSFSGEEIFFGILFIVVAPILISLCVTRGTVEDYLDELGRTRSYETPSTRYTLVRENPFSNDQWYYQENTDDSITLYATSREGMREVIASYLKHKDGIGLDKFAYIYGKERY